MQVMNMLSFAYHSYTSQTSEC